MQVSVSSLALQTAQVRSALQLDGAHTGKVCTAGAAFLRLREAAYGPSTSAGACRLGTLTTQAAAIDAGWQPLVTGAGRVCSAGMHLCNSEGHSALVSLASTVC